MRFKRLLIGAMLCLVMIVGALLGARDYLLHTLITHQLDDIGARIGEQISLESATLKSLEQVTLRGLSVGDDRWVHLDRLEMRLRWSDLITRLLARRRPHIEQIVIIDPTVRLRGRDLKSTLQMQKARIRAVMKHLNRGSKAGASRITRIRAERFEDQLSAFEKRLDTLLRALPPIRVVSGTITGAREALFLHQIKLTVRDGLIKGSWWGEAPQTGYCQVSGSAHAFKLHCNNDFHIPVKNFEIAGRQLEWTGGIDPSVSLKGLHLKRLSNMTQRLKSNVTSRGAQETKVRRETAVGETSALVSQLPFSEVRLDLKAGLRPNDNEQYPLTVDLVFPGGGSVSAKGFASRLEAELSTQVSGFSMRSLARGQSGTLSADARIWANWVEGKANLKGKLTLTRAIVNHPKLSKSAVGPFDMSAEGMAHVDWEPHSPKRFEVAVTGARAQLDAISGHLNFNWNQKGEAPHLKGSFEVPRLKASRFASSIPTGLMPHLQPLELGGRIGFRGSLDLDLANLKKTKLIWVPYLRRLKVRSMNEAIDFKALSKRFNTRFEMPNGDVFTRETGPESDRWVRLEDMPELLPTAVTAQEDGGFYKHKGISLFHLRGSLIKNLKEGRFVRGGSTLTMQLIKNLYLHRKKTLSRKLEEVCLAWLIERALNKDELITLYLNIVEFGDNVFGIKEAARAYFDKEPIDLIPEEISALTRLLPGPRLYERYFRRKRLSRAYTNRVNRLLKLLQKRKHIDEDDWDLITRTSLWDRPPPVPSYDEPSSTGDVVDEIEGLDTPDLTRAERERGEDRDAVSGGVKSRNTKSRNTKSRNTKSRNTKSRNTKRYQPRARELSDPF